MAIEFEVSQHFFSQGVVASIELTSKEADYVYAFYLVRNGERIARKPYTGEKTVFFPMDTVIEGEYRVTGFILEKGSAHKVSKHTPPQKIKPQNLPQFPSPIKRSIRLKEWGQHCDEWKRPSPAYLAGAENLVDDYYRLRTDESGFIVSGKDWSKSRHPKEKWVFMGASFLECLYLPESERLTALIEKKLNAAGHLVQCLNGGYSGATTLHLVNILLNKVVPIKPSRVVLFVPTNDARVLELAGGYWRDDKLHSPFTPPTAPADTYGGKYGEKSLIGLLELALVICTHWRINLTLATTPHRHMNYALDGWLQRRFPAEDYFKKVARKRSAINNSVRRFASAMSLPIIDLEKMAKDYRKYSYDDLHLTPYGAEALANYSLASLQDLDGAM